MRGLSPGRAWRRFRRRPLSSQLTTAVVSLAVIAGLCIWIGNAPSSLPAQASSGSSSNSSHQATTTNVNTGAFAHASTAAPGVTAHSISVAFPISNLTALAGQLGFSSDIEFSQQKQEVNTFVNDINQSGGINGRKIKPVFANFDPTNESDMRSLCKDWTEGSGAVFAVLDGMGAWTGDNQLCIAQEGHTPLISAWSTVSSWTSMGAPYLWWTGPSQNVILQTLVQWGEAQGYINATHKIGVLAGSRASDQAALKDALLPALKQAGVEHPVVQTIDADPSDSAQTGSQAPLAVQTFHSDHVDTLIPLVPFNVMFPFLQAQSQQNYYPRLLLSDYEQSIESALGLIPVPYNKALNNQEGVTTETLGGIDDPGPPSQGGYYPGTKSCYQSWVKAYPKPPKGRPNNYIDSQGPVVLWCQAIRLFAAAAQSAGPNLNRKTFVQAMAKIKNFPGTVSPLLTYGTSKFYGPIQYRVVRLHNNVPPSSQCYEYPKGSTGNQTRIQGTCWVIVQNWQPLANS